MFNIYKKKTYFIYRWFLIFWETLEFSGFFNQ